VILLVDWNDRFSVNAHNGRAGPLVDRKPEIRSCQAADTHGSSAARANRKEARRYETPPVVPARQLPGMKLGFRDKLRETVARVGTI
jgi:hypothetical protein